MAINARAVVRVIIEGEWIWVERGTFTVIDFQFEDDDGNLLNRNRDPAYFFLSTNGDPYFGPLTSLSLIKLDNQILEEGGGEVAEKVRLRALGPGDSDGPTRDADGAEESESGAGESGEADAEGGKRDAVPLFAGDSAADEADSDGEDDGSKRKSGLF